MSDTDSLDERTPLLYPAGDGREPKSHAVALSATRDETATLISYSLPTFGSNFLEYSLSLVPMLSLGHISTEVLAAGTLAMMTANVTGSIVAMSFASALDTMLPPAWTSNDPSLVGLWAQRMFVVMAILNIPMLLVWHTSESILLFLRQDPQVAHLAGTYLRVLSLGLPAFCANQIFRRFFQCQGLFSVPTAMIAIAAPVNVVLNYLLVWGPEPIRMGFTGAALATALSFNLIMVMSFAYLTWFMPSRRACRPISFAIFRELGILAYLGFAGVAQTASEWVAWEAMTLASSSISTEAVAAQSILIVTCTTTFQAAYAIAIATSVRVGNLLGEGDALRAKISSNAGLVIGTVTSVIWCTLFIVFRRTWAYMFNDDPVVVHLVATLMPLAGMIQLLDGVNTVSSGVLRACGRQGFAAIVIFISYYLVGIPSSMGLAFAGGLGLAGLWYGLSLGYGLATVLQLAWLRRVDWQREADEARERLRSGDGVQDPEAALRGH